MKKSLSPLRRWPVRGPYALAWLLILAGAAGANWWLRTPAPPALAVTESSHPMPPGRYLLRGTVVQVADGDTVTLQTANGSHRIRLDSIDAPETGHGPQQPGQPFAQAARQRLAALVADRSVQAQCYEQDRFGRDVCALIGPDGQSVNRALVASGHAWAYTARRGEYLRDKAMPALQAQASQARQGLWAQPNPHPPWQWRYNCWQQQHCD